MDYIKILEVISSISVAVMVTLLRMYDDKGLSKLKQYRDEDKVLYSRTILIYMTIFVVTFTFCLLLLNAQLGRVLDSYCPLV